MNQVVTLEDALLADAEIPDQFKHEGRTVLVLERMSNFHYRALVLGMGGGGPFWLSNADLRKTLRSPA